MLTALGARVRAFRLESHLTVKDLAKLAVLSPRFINQLEAGTGNISIAGLARVSSALGRLLPELLSPSDDDHSTRAQVWRGLSDCSDDDWQALQRWLEQRQGQSSTPRFIALIGLRGAGKSTIGMLLAKRLKTEFVELDQRIEEAAGMPLGEIFSLHGESYYRRLEREALNKLFALSSGCVLAPGGSVVTDAESWEMVKRRCFTVWLHATPQEFMRRMRRQGDIRPMQGRPSAMTELKALLARRTPLYAESQFVIKTSRQSTAAIIAQIIKQASARR